MNIPDDPFIVELLPEFIDTWIEDIENQMQPILDKKNTDDLYRFGHTLKGSCFQFGLDEVAQMGIELMGYSKVQNWEKATEMQPLLKKAFQDTKVYVETQLNK